jgi:excisionase family DNA binding protein
VKTLDLSECADFLKIDRTTALRLAGEGELPGAKIGRAWVFLEEDLVEYLRAKAREQARQRLAETTIAKDLHAAAIRNPPTYIPTGRGRRRQTPPELPELSGQVAPAKIGVAS